MTKYFALFAVAAVAAAAAFGVSPAEADFYDWLKQCNWEVKYCGGF